MEYPGGIIVFKIPDVSHIHESSSVQFGKEKIIQNPEPVLDIPFQFDVSHPVKILQIPISIWLTVIVIKSAWTDGSGTRSEEHTSELQSLMRISYAVFCLIKKKKNIKHQ